MGLLTMLNRWSSQGRRSGGAGLESALLATAFVLAGATAAAGCKDNEKARAESHASPAASAAAALSAGPSGTPPGNTVRRESGGCLLLPPSSCAPGQPCKSGAFHVDCPQNLLAGEPPPIKRRPEGKESWIRVKPWIYFDEEKKGCAYTTESFCSPPGTFAQCTPSPSAVAIACTRNTAVHTMDVSSFVYVDSTGVCHKVPTMTCTANHRGLCDLPEGEVVPCPAK
jgi:hypothetical protein